MTIVAERHRYAGTHEVPAGRHRRPFELLDIPREVGEHVVALFLALVAWFKARPAVAMTARAIGRLIVVGAVAVGMLLGFGALVAPDRSPAAPPAIIVTPSPTPYPGGWTYRP